MQLNDAIEKLAAIIDPPVFKDHLPIPTRQDTIDWYERRKSAFDKAINIVATWPDIVPIIATKGD